VATGFLIFGKHFFNMGLFDAFKKKEETPADSAGQKKPKEKQEKEEDEPQGKYDETCSACGKAGTEKKWMGQYWHKKCLRSSRRAAKGMI